MLALSILFITRPCVKRSFLLQLRYVLLRQRYFCSSVFRSYALSFSQVDISLLFPLSLISSQQSNKQIMKRYNEANKKSRETLKQTNKENSPLLSSPPLSSRHLTFPPCQWLGLCYKSNHASKKYFRAPTAFSQLAFPTPGVQHCLSLSTYHTPHTPPHGVRRPSIFVEIYQWWKGPSKF